MTDRDLNGLEIAIIGLAGRFPGAKNVAQYWQNLRDGVETISSFSNDELLSSGVKQSEIQDPSYVRRGGTVDGVELFDATFFGYSPREAALLDPQQRLFLECAEEALEDAGYDPRRYHDTIGVYAGTGLNNYFLHNLYLNQDRTNIGDMYQIITANDKDFLATRVAYKLNLRGPALVVQTACSTSLVAVHLAVRSLLSGECTMALAGGVTLRIPQKMGYRYQEGGILSPDGHCRAFDAQAAGTVASSGAGIVVLKRLEDALADRDHLYAIIKGSAINNDGSMKVGYTAPGLQGQARVIQDAQFVAGVDVESIGYIETHGTGTVNGDPIEIAALTEAFRAKTTKEGFCAIGSVKTNIGHLDTASGVAGLIKAVYSLRQRVLLPSLHIQKPNPALRLEKSPFYINRQLCEWKESATPRRAGVSSFGIGGTNAHVVLEEAPEPENAKRARRPQQLVMLSARTESALKQMSLNLAAHLRQNPELDLADVAYTLQVGRPLLRHRQALLCSSLEDVALSLETNDVARLMRGIEDAYERPVVWMFPGQGAQYVDMGRDLYQAEPVFRTELERCATLLRPHLGFDLLTAFYPVSESERKKASERLKQTSLTQPALFAVSYALAKQWEAWGVHPSAMIGHSIGEYVAACLAGVFSLENALRLVAARGRLMQQLPEGAMLAVELPEQELQAYLTEHLSLAAVNTHKHCVVAGTVPEIDRLEQQLRAAAIECQRLHTSHAFHSPMVEPVLEEFVALVASVQLHQPELPYISNLTGTWITAEQACDPHYWGQHMRQQVRFASGMTELLRETDAVLLEVGPGRTLSTFAHHQSLFLALPAGRAVVTSLRRPTEKLPDDEFLLAALGRLWLAGVPISWQELHADEMCRRVSLPTYPFERQRYWIDPPPQKALSGAVQELYQEGMLQELPEMAISTTFSVRPDITTQYVPPRNHLEQTLVTIWQQLLGISLVGIYDSFFELGGHSLLATQLVSRLRSDLQVSLPLSTIFEATTIAELAQAIAEDDRTRLSEDALALPLQPIARGGRLPLSYAQKRLWFMQQMEQDAGFMNIPLGIRLRGPLDQELLQRSLQEIVNRHETLRTTFLLMDGEPVPVPVIAPTLPLTIEVEDLQNRASAEQNTTLQRLATECVGRSFDLTRGPLLRVSQFKLDADDCVLVFTMHHSISDGWSFSVLVHELIQLYSSFLNGGPSLEPLAVQYVDFAAWQQQWLSGAELERQLAYWRQQLGGPLPVLDLPTDYPRPALQTYRGTHFPFKLPVSLTEDIRVLSQQEGATLFMTLLTAFQIVCARYSGQEDILTGTSIANRQRTELESLIGCFINTLVIRTNLVGNPSFRELLRKVRETTLAAYAHQDLPFEQLVVDLQPTRDLSRAPIFQAMFMLQNVPIPATEFVDLHLSTVDIDNGATQFDLTFIITETAECITGLVEYNVDLFKPETIGRMVEHWQCILTGSAEDCTQRVADMPLLTSVERQRLNAWNQTAVLWEEPVCIQDVFAAQVARTPDAVALIWEEKLWTYSGLQRAADRVASSLQALGVGPGTLVGICLQRSAEFLIAILGVLKAGGAYVPLDPAYPPERIYFMLANSQAVVLVTEESVRDQLAPNEDLALLLLPLPNTETQREAPQIVRTSGEDLAYVIYTSGSTGKPKGVMISHRALHNCLKSMAREPGIACDERVLAVTSFSFDIAALELLLPLITGASVTIASQVQTRDAQALLSLCAMTHASFMQATPATWQMLFNVGWEGRPGLKMLSGGEALPLSLAQRLCHHSDDVWNMYGPTETTIWSTTCKVQADDLHISVGYPIANTQVYILDRYGAEQPLGVAGELYIGGDGLAHGYWRLPAMTAERFVPDPFSTKPGARLYRTGDLVRRMADGSLFYLNRLDFQVKIRGHRIELGEIETKLMQHPSVRECIAGVCEVHKGDAKLVAYILLQQDTMLDTQEIRRYLQSQLPEYMVPSYFVRLPVWPLTPNGKVDRKALFAIELAVTDDDMFTAPKSALEEILVDVWARVLQRKTIGTRENFFDLGGHSLLATQLLAQVRSLLSLEIPLRSLFEAPTVAEFATLIGEKLAGTKDQQLPPLLPLPREQYLPVSFAQQRFWFLEQLEPDTAAYHIPAGIRIRGHLDSQMLQCSLAGIVARHESLRTTFSMRNGQLKQTIQPFIGFSLTHIDLHLLEQGARESELQRLVAEEVLRPFHLGASLLMRAALFEIDKTEHVLLITLHHIVADGPSCNILLDELIRQYAASVMRETPSLPDLSIQYADFASWQRQWLHGAFLDTQLDYWKRQLSGVVALELPTDHPRPATQTFRGAESTFMLPRPLTIALQELSKREGVTLFMTLLAAFQVLLSCYTGQNNIAVGTPVTNRNRVEFEGLIGLFVNTLVLRTDLADQPGFSKLLMRVRETCLQAYSHQELPFELIVDALQPQRDLSHPPLFQVMFMLHHMPDIAVPEALSQLHISQFPIASRRSKFDLTLEFVVKGEDIQGRMEYATDLFEAETIERMIGHLQTLLEGIVANPDARITTFPLLTEAEYQCLIRDWNATDASYPASQCLHQLLEAQAELTSERVAVIFADEHLSYRELHRRANQLAHYLQTMGVGPEVRVGIYMEPALEMLIAVCAILKAGGVYVPIDLTYPRDRVTFLLRDAQMSILLTQQRAKLPTLPQQVKVLALDAVELDLRTQCSDSPDSGVGPDNLAYILYTSGSTGVPKGVMIPHRGLVNYLSWCSQRYTVADGAGAPVHSGIHFDLTVTSLFSPLLTGRSVFLLPSERGVEALSMAFQRYNDLSLVKITPAHLALLSQQPGMHQYAAHSRLFVLGGEQLLAENLTFWQELAPETQFINEYGPTETVVGCCVYQVPVGQRDTGPVPIGRPIANTQIYLLNQDAQLVPIGVPGELYIGGAGVARGYLNQPELTAIRFVPDPFSQEGGRRLYKTGDVARYRCDGVLEFLGRNDDQVKIRGFRIELGEVEAVLSHHPAIRDCAVIVREDTPAAPRLVAYVVPKQAEAKLLHGELRDYVQQQLPEYMVPAFFVQLEGLPLSTNGKLERRALPLPGEVKNEAGTEFVGPRTQIEQTLASIWAEVLGIDRVSIHDNFFRLGGDSILSMQIIARAALANIRLTPRQVFQQQTIEALASVVNTHTPFQAEQEVVIGSLSLTPIQHWFFAQKLQEPHHWNQSALLELAVRVDRGVLQKALETLFLHHDALRLRFTQHQEQWQQVNAGYERDMSFFTSMNLMGLSSAEQMHAVEVAQEQSQSGFDLARGPLLHAVFFDRGLDAPALLLLCIHHLVVDTVSWQILLADLQIAYRALLHQVPVQLPPKTTSYRRWAEQLVQYAQSEEVLQEQLFWLEENSVTALALPLDFPAHEANTMASVRTSSFSLSQEETRALQERVAQAYDCPLGDIILAMLALALARWLGTDTVQIDTEGHGREEISDDIDVSRTVGWFTSIYPLALQFQDTSSESDAVRCVKEKRARLPHKGFGYGILRYLNVDPQVRQRFNSLPQSDILLNYVGRLDQIISSATLFKDILPSSDADRGPHDLRPYLFEITSGIRGGEFFIDWKYSAHMHRQETIVHLITEVIQGLRALLLQSQAMDIPAQPVKATKLSRWDAKQTAPDKEMLLVPVSRDQPLPLSLAQQRLWFLAQLMPESSLYNITRSLHIRGRLNEAALRRSVEEIVMRHEVLRTTFPAIDGKAIQDIHPYADVGWTEFDLLSDAEAHREARVALHEEALKPIDLARGPLLRILLVKVDTDYCVMAVTTHHIVFDVWSEIIFLRELMELYKAFVAGQPSPLSALTLQYADFVIWQRQWLQGGILDEQIAYWQKQLQHPTLLELPTDRPRREIQSYNGAWRAFSFEKELSSGLVNLGRQEGVTLFTTLLTGFMTLLRRYSGQSDIIVGTDIANRSQVETEQLIGFFVNLLVLRADLSGNPRFVDVLQQVGKMLLDVYAHQDLPFEKLIEVLRLEREGGQTPLVRVMFVFHNVPLVTLDVGDIVITPIPVEQECTRFELAFFMWETTDGLKGTVNYSTDLFEEATITTMLMHFKVLMQNICAQPSARLDTLKIYNEEIEVTKRASRLSRLKKAKRVEIVSSE